MGWAIGWSTGWVLAVALHLGALVAGAEVLADVTQCLITPLLAGALVAATRWPRGHVVTWSLAGLGACFLGDAAPRLLAGDAAFLAMVGCFLVAQVAYVVAFAPRVRRSVVRTRPVWLVAYAAALVALVALCAPHAGPLLVPVAVYGGLLTAMAVLATGLGPLGAAGGAVFLVSDALIALGRFVPGWDLPGHDVAVMLTYAVGLGLLVLAVARDDRTQRTTSAARTRERAAASVRAERDERDNVVPLVAVRRRLEV
ncbi:lysoplasmalogenase [Cellulomonas sp. DKR-3]|uniref:Lysoplasmalogenase n=2 Tax=Cellulomonas fulva TaxID=2835530 RepID=A0ABS5U0E3_9CELL|nr:lysoplasmalogenase [Cellulomonas fulva]